MVRHNFSHTTPLDAVILAGGRRTRFDKSLPNKNFIKIKNRPLFLHVLSALLKVKQLGKIYIVGPKNEIEKELSSFPADELPAGRLFAVQESRNLVNNVMKAFWESVGGVRVRDEETEKEIMEKTLLLVAGDSPLVSPYEIEQFVDGCDLANYDYFMGMTPSSSMEYYTPKPDRIGVRFAYAHFSEGLFRINNIHMVKPLHVKHRQEFMAMYRVRHLMELVDVIRCGTALTKRSITLGDLFQWVKMMTAMFLTQAGIPAVADYLRRNIPMQRWENLAGKLLGTRAKIVVTTYGGAAIDVDKKSILLAIEKNFDDWQEHQKRIAKTKKEDSLTY